MTVTVQFDAVAIHRLLHDVDGPVMRSVYRRGKRVEVAAKRGCPVDQGRLRSSITTQFHHAGNVTVVRVGTDVAYARFVHDGTGLYGPRGVVIRPRSARILRFEVGGDVAYARFVRGVRGRPFITDALPAAG